MINREFSTKNGKHYIGETEVNSESKDVLQQEALYLKESHILDVLNNAIESECFRLGVLEATEWKDTQFSQALWHYKHVLNNLIVALSKSNKPEPPIITEETTP